jgi:hypothetical protein
VQFLGGGAAEKLKSTARVSSIKAPMKAVQALILTIGSQVRQHGGYK